MKKSVWVALVLVLVLSLCLTACGGNNDDATEPDDQGDTGEEVTKLVVGSMVGYQPYAYVDEDDTVKGFEIAVVDEAVSRMENVEVEYTVLPWESLLLSLESDKVQVVSCQLWRTDERVEKYNMATVPYFECGGRMMVAANTNDVETLEDLNGREIATTVGDAYTTYLEKYNEENDDVLNIKYYSEDISTILQDVASGRVTATINEPNMMMARAELMNIQSEVKLVGDLVESGFTYLAFQKNEEGAALRDKFDKVYQEMIEDGTLSKISMEYFNGEDYAKNLMNGIVTDDAPATDDAGAEGDDTAE